MIIAGRIASMTEILGVTFPFFALVLAGYVAAYRRMLPIEAIPGLNSFVLFFALPCLLYRFGAKTPIAQLLDGSLFFTYLLCAALLVAFTVAISLNQRIRWNDASFGALVSAFPNTGFMGVPLLVALLGPQSAGPAIVPFWWTCSSLALCALPCRAWMALAPKAPVRRHARRSKASWPTPCPGRLAWGL